MFSVALSRGLPRVGVTDHRALPSPDFPPGSLSGAPSGHLIHSGRFAAPIIYDSCVGWVTPADTFTCMVRVHALAPAARARSGLPVRSAAGRLTVGAAVAKIGHPTRDRPNRLASLEELGHGSI